MSAPAGCEQRYEATPRGYGYWCGLHGHNAILVATELELSGSRLAEFEEGHAQALQDRYWSAYEDDQTMFEAHALDHLCEDMGLDDV